MKHKTKCRLAFQAGTFSSTFGVAIIINNFNRIAPIETVMGTLIILFGIVVMVVFRKEEKKGE